MIKNKKGLLASVLAVLIAINVICEYTNKKELEENTNFKEETEVNREEYPKVKIIENLMYENTDASYTFQNNGTKTYVASERPTCLLEYDSFQTLEDLENTQAEEAVLKLVKKS